MLHFNKNKNLFLSLTTVFFVFCFFGTALAQNGPVPVLDTPSDTTVQLPDNTLTPTNTLPATPAVNTDTTYTPLAPLTDELDGPYQTATDCPLGKYMGILFNLFMGIAAVLAMIMIFAGGIEYMGSELISSKEAGMSKVKNAIGGLLLALAAYLILDTINPKLLDVCLGNIPKAQITIDPGEEGTGNFTPSSSKSLTDIGINCPGSGGIDALPAIAESFAGKVNYSHNRPPTIGGSPPKVNLDCSGFAKQVYACAGLNLPGSGTWDMFQGSESLSGNAPGDLKVGDLLGWAKGESTKYTSSGHMVMYIGNGKYIEVNSKGVLINSIDHYNGSYFHVKRRP